MNVEFKEVEHVIKTLPIGYYLTRGATVTLSADCKATFAHILNDEIVVSYPMIKMALAPLPETDPETLEKAIRCLLYHEVSHLFITPTEFSGGEKYNIMEDERMETLLRAYYLKVNFKWFAKLMNGGTDGGDERLEGRDALRNTFYRLVRFRNYRWCPAHQEERVKAVSDIIRNYAELGRNSASYICDRYEFAIDDLWREVERDLEIAKEEEEKKRKEEEEKGEKGDSSDGGDSGDSSDDDADGDEGKDSKGDAGKGSSKGTKGKGGKDKGSDDSSSSDDASSSSDDSESGDSDSKEKTDGKDGTAGKDASSKKKDSKSGSSSKDKDGKGGEDDEKSADESASDGSDGEKGDKSGDKKDGEKGKSDPKEKSGDDGESDGSDGDSADGEAEDGPSEGGEGEVKDSARSSSGKHDTSECGEPRSGEPDGGVEEDEDDEDDPARSSDAMLSRKDVEKLVEKLFNSKSLPPKDMAALERIFRAAEKKRSSSAAAVNAHSGVIDPRQVALRNDYRWWLHQNPNGSHARFAKTHLTLFMDVSGSFCSSQGKLNALVQALMRVKKSNRNFEFDIIAMGDSNRMFDPRKDKEIRCCEGNYFGLDIVPLARKCKRSDCENYQLVVFDGDAMSCDGWSYSRREDFRNANMSAWRVFDDPNTVIVTDSCNTSYLDKAGVSKAKRIVVESNYADKFIENVIKLLSNVIAR